MSYDSIDQPAGPSALIQPGELLLAFGIGFFALTIAAMHFVMGMFLAVIPAIIALPLLIAGMLRARDRAGVTGRQLGGALLLILGMGTLLAVTSKTCALSWQQAFHAVRPTVPGPTQQQWLAVSVAWFLPALLGYPGTVLWTNWSRSRRLFWCGVTVALSPGVISLHRALAKLGFPLYA
jgi:uncharacterized membrane protein YidH (DUF202 family)